MPKQSYDPGKQAMTPGNRYTYANFVDSALIYSHQGRGARNQKITEKHSYVQCMPYTLAQFSAQEPWAIVKQLVLQI